MSIICIVYTYQGFNDIHDNGSNNKLFDTKIIVRSSNDIDSNNSSYNYDNENSSKHV